MANSSCASATADALFGPQVEPCVRQFDFTWTFENIFLSITPSVLLLLLGPARLWMLSKQRKRVARSAIQIAKLSTILLFAGTQLALLALSPSLPVVNSPTSIAASALTVVDTICLCSLSYVEHNKSIRPSSLLTVYLFFSTLFDAVRARTLWLLNDTSFAAVFTAGLALKAVAFALEVTEKKTFLHHADRQRNPEELAGIFNRSFFIWLNRLIRTGFHKVLHPEDLYSLDEQLHTQTLIARFQQIWVHAESKKNALMIALVKATLRDFLSPMFPRLVMVAFSICQPILMNTFLAYLDQSDKNLDVGYGLIAAYAIVYLGLGVATGFYFHHNYRWAAMIRGILVSEVYRKTTEISLVALDNSAAVTLMSTDVERIVVGIIKFHEIWANLLQVALATYLLQAQLGWACFAPLFLALISMVATLSLSSRVGERQMSWMKMIHKRVGITSSTLANMKGIKMAGINDRLNSIIQSLRVTEIAAARKFRELLIVVASLAFFPQFLAAPLAFIVFTAISFATDTSLDTARLFTSISLITLLTSPLSQMFQAFPTIAAAFGCVTRIQTFLNAESRSDHRLTTIELLTPPSPSSMTDRSDIELLTLPPVKISSSLPQDIISVQNGSFGWKADEPVIKDVTMSIPRSKLTMIIGPVACGKSTLLKALLGETPSTKGFVHIASRAIFSFCDQTPWLTNTTIKKNVVAFSDFNQLWYNEVIHACALDEDIKSYENGDETLVGSKGISLSGGQKQRLALARAVYSKRSVLILDDVFSGLDATTEHTIFTRLLGPNGILRRHQTTVVFATHAVNLLPSADQIIALGSSGSIIEQGTFQELNTLPGYVQSLSVRDSEVETSDRTVAVERPRKTTSTPIVASRTDGEMAVYKFYVKLVGVPFFVLFILLEALFGFLVSFPTVWLKWWSDANAEEPNQNVAMYLGVYCALQILGVLDLAAIVWHVLAWMAVRCGNRIHQVMLTTVLSAPLSFFTTSDSGSTLSRFSQDLEIIDGELHMALLNFGADVFTIIGESILIATSSKYVAISYPFLLVVFYAIQKIYLRTSRQLRLLDLETKGPLYTQFTESLSGLATIRAFSWEAASRELNHELLNASQSPFYLFYITQRWLNIVLDMIGTVVAVMIVALAVCLPESSSAGFTGVALVSLISFSEAMVLSIEHWTMLETSIGAVARAKEFEKTVDSENLPGENAPTPLGWPAFGALEVDGLTAKYGSTDKPALRDISFTVGPGEKLGICGRSGSGKSSLLLALYRMINITGGSIKIDGVDLASLPRTDVRSRITTISQDSYFIAGSVRLNLDPYGSSDDATLELALKKVQLWDQIAGGGGLDADLDVETLSHGQRQLFSLARASLHSSAVVVLDEVTSSVDRDTELLMQRIIRDDFKGRTIIAVAHRLETIMDFDRIALMGDGQLRELDSPAALLAGPTEFKKLYDMYSSNREQEANAVVE